MATLAEELPSEMERVRQVLKRYKALGPAGRFGAIMINHSLREAEKAIANGDVVAMMRAYRDLQAFRD